MHIVAQLLVGLALWFANGDLIGAQEVGERITIVLSADGSMSFELPTITRPLVRPDGSTQSVAMSHSFDEARRVVMLYRGRYPDGLVLRLPKGEDCDGGLATRSAMSFLDLGVAVVECVETSGDFGAERSHHYEGEREVLPAERLAEQRAARPAPKADIGVRLRWLWSMAVLADQARRYELAEAYLLGVEACMPEDGSVLGTLACYIGKQGRYAEALTVTDRAIRLGRGDPIQLNLIKATWLAHLGQIEAAEGVLELVDEPDVVERADYDMYHVCMAFYHARITGDAALVRSSVERVRSGGNEHWEAFFRHDVSFDGFREANWFDRPATDDPSDPLKP